MPVTLQAHDLSTDDHPLVKIVGMKMPKEAVMLFYFNYMYVTSLPFGSNFNIYDDDVQYLIIELSVVQAYLTNLVHVRNYNQKTCTCT